MKEVIVCIVAMAALVGVVLVKDNSQDIKALQKQQAERAAATEQKLTTVAEKQAALEAMLKIAMQKNNSASEEMATQVASVKKEITALEEKFGAPVNVDEKESVACAIKISALSDPAVREKICEVMGLLGGDPIESRLIEMAKNDKKDSVCAYALDALIRLKSKRLGPVAQDLLASDTDDIRRKASQALKVVPYAPAKGAMLAALQRHIDSTDYDDREMRANLYNALKTIATPQDFAPIHALYKKESKKKQEAFALLLQIGGGEYERILELLEGNTNKNVVTEDMIKKLIPQADIRLTAPLLPVLDSDNWTTRRGMVLLLNKLKDPAAAKALCLRYKKESDSDCKRAMHELFLVGYPGITYDENTKKCSLVPDAELKKLIAERDAKLKTLVKAKAAKPGAKE